MLLEADRGAKLERKTNRTQNVKNAARPAIRDDQPAKMSNGPTRRPKRSRPFGASPIRCSHRAATANRLGIA
jgi:hypothetical protein